MNAEESLALCRLAKGAFPATNMDEFTPEAWSLALEDERFGDAREALKLLMREQTFIHVSDIVKRVARIRRERIVDFGLLPCPPMELADDPREYMAWMRATTRAIADGDLVERPALPAPGSHPDIDFDSILQSANDA